MLKNSILFILVPSLILSLSLSGCVRFKEKIRISEEFDLKEGKNILNNFFKVRKQSFQTVKTRVKVMYSDAKGKFKCDALMLLKMPDNMRIEILNVFDQPLLLLTYSNDELFIYSAAENQYEYRCKSRGDLGYLVERFQLFIPFIFGDFEYLKDFKLKKCIKHDEGKLVEFFLDSPKDEGRFFVNLLLDPQTNRVHQLTYKDSNDDEGLREYLLSYLRYGEEESTNFPTSFEMQITKGKNSGLIRLNFKDPVINEEISKDKFSFMIPEFAKRGGVSRIFDWLN